MESIVFQSALYERLGQFSHSIAVEYKERTLTYDALDKKSDGIANWIIGNGIPGKTFIGIFMEDRLELITTLIGILKAGCVFVPLDISFPRDRIEGMIRTSGVKFIFCDHSQWENRIQLTNLSTQFILFNAIFDGEENTCHTLRPDVQYDPDDPIYIYFTSGSTGTPKAILGRNKSLLHFINWEVDTFGVDSRFRISQFTTPGFDAFLRDLFVPLFSGGTVCIPGNKEIMLNSSQLVDWIENNSICLIHCVPSFFRMMNTYPLGSENFQELKYILLSGEPIYPSELVKWYDTFGDRIQLVNFYGPTETTMIKSFYLLQPADTKRERIPIGKPMRGTRFIICDDEMNPCDELKSGEIYIRTPYMTLGYYNDPQLNKKRFIPNPFTNNPGDLLYKTGDLGKLLPDGNFELLGRLDRQVKIRGVRVELEEIEHVMMGHSAVREAAIIKEKISDTNELLCGYFTGIANNEAEDAQLIESVRIYLSKKLPDYMVPAKLVIIEEMVKKPNGKIDYEALSAGAREKEKSIDITGPRNEIEKKLFAIWSDILENASIGVEKSFFELGGNSLNIMILLSKIYKEFDVRMTLGEIFENLTIAKQAEIINVSQTGHYPAIEHAEEKKYYRLTSAQKRLYILQQMELDHTTYNIPMFVILKGNLERDRLACVFENLIQRHESFRTSFEISEGEIFQRVHPISSFQMEYHELPEGVAPGEETLEEMIIQTFVRPFDLSVTPLVRFGLVRIAPEHHLLMADMHHIIADGFSQTILAKDLMALYNNETIPLLKFQYKDFSEWFINLSMQEIFLQQKEYWLQQFSGEIPVLDLPIDFTRPVTQSFAGDRFDFEIEPEETLALNQLAAREDTTLYVVLLSLFNLFLAKLGGQDDIVVGTAVAGRKEVELESIVGMFVNTLPMRNFPKGDLLFTHFLKAVHDNTVKAFENQDYPFENLVDSISIARSANRNPLFDVMFVLQNMKPAEIKIPHLTLVPYVYENKTAKFDLTLMGEEREGKLCFSLGYCIDLFKKETIKRFAFFFRRIISAVLNDTFAELARIEIISPAERKRIVDDYNATDTPYPRDKTVRQLFEECVATMPDNIAVVFESKSLTYRDLHQKSNQLAGRLWGTGVGRGDVAAIMIDPSLEMIIVIMAVLKVGAAFLPISPDSPSGRMMYILMDSSAKILLTVEKNTRVLQYSGPCLYIDDPGIYEMEVDIPFMLGDPSDFHYLIYTSGTTGRPKGAIITNRNMVNYSNWYIKQFQLGQEDKAILLASFAFDLGYSSIIPPLLSGGQTHLVAKEVYLLAESLLSYIHSFGITCLKLTPSLFSTFIYSPDFSQETCASLRLIVLGGEPVNVEDLRHLHHVCKNIKVVNEYGPTETTIGCLDQFIDLNGLAEYQEQPTVGRPIFNYRVYILDKWMNIAPIGVTGELYIAGEGVGVGYLNQPQMTSQRFIENPFSPGTVFYKTGDLARWNPDGNIQFLCRIDTQVKVRGFRIELGEIEAQLEKYQDVKEATVVIREYENAEKYLCAYMVSHSKIDILALKNFLSLQLPDYMVPAHYMQIERTPLTPNGKIDLRALPEPEKADAINTYPLPEDKISRLMTIIWSEVLSIKEERIGLDTNFFSVGGHSLKATLMLSRLYKEFNVKVPLKELFRQPTIRNISEYIQRAAKEVFVSIESIELKEYYPLSSAQKRLYVLQQLEEESTAYNLSSVMQLVGLLNQEKLTHTFFKLIQRHEAFRTSFHMLDDVPMQKIYGQVHFEVELYTLEKEIRGEQDGTGTIIKKFMRPFDLSHAPLFRVGLINMGEGAVRHVLMVEMHHIISDGISSGILMRDFMTLYGGGELAALRTHYKDFAQWQNHLLTSRSIMKQEEYWLAEFAGDIPVLNLYTDYPRPQARSFNGGAVQLHLGGADTMAIKSLAAKEKSTTFMFLLAICHVWLAKLSAQEEVVIGTPIAGRRHADLYSIIGMFVNTLALKNFPKGELPFAEFLQMVKERTLEAFENQDYQFERLVEKTVAVRDGSTNPLFDVMFSFRNEGGLLKIEIPGLTLTEKEYERGTAKFDLTIIAEEVAEQFVFHFEYSTALFKAETIQMFATYFKRIVTSVLSDPGEKIAAISLMGDDERTRLLVSFNETQTPYPSDKTIHELFAQQVSRTPDGIALSQQTEMTYHQLNQKANQLARILRGKGIKPDSVVGIMTGPSQEMIIGILAILKAGGAYIPIDPEYPEKRVQFMIQNSQAEVLLVQNRYMAVHDSAIETLILEDESLYSGDSTDPVNLNKPDDLVYIIYTSGSTGAAKGILLEHKGLVNYVKWAEKQYLNGEKLDFPLYSSLSFDLTVTSIYVPLVTGNKILLYPQDETEFVIGKIVAEGRAGIIKLTPTHLGILAQMPLDLQNNSIKKMIVGGEELTTELARRIYDLFGGELQIFNEYGPTEAIVGCMIHRFDPLRDKGRSVPIGVPISNAKIYILDALQQLVAPGIPGELCVSGDGLARGYLNRPELTVDKFIHNPFVPGSFLYRTGDAARWLPNGKIEFLGRMDNQVKIRGHRLEPGEIEYQLLTHPDIKEAAVIAKEDRPGSGGMFLCAYVVSPNGLAPLELREYLSSRLPLYMVPSYFVSMEKMPLTASGKLNLRALPEPERNASEDYTAPESDIEKKLVETWASVLGVDRVGIHDNFFQIGGDSVKAIQISSRLMRAGLKLQIRDIFRTPTIHELSRCIKKTDLIINQGPVAGEVTLNPIQLWFFLHNFSEQHHFNQSLMVYSPNGFSQTKIKDIFTAIVTHHDVLRLVVETREEKIGLRNRGVTEDTLFDLEKITVNHSDKSAIIRQIESESERLEQSIDLKEGPLVKLGLFHTTTGDYLLMVIHHLVIDGVSWRILLEDFNLLARQIEAGLELKLPPKTTSFKEWTEKLNSYATAERLLAELPYWTGIEQTIVTPLRKDRTVTRRKRLDSKKISIELAEPYTRKLLTEVNQTYQTEMNDILLTALGFALRDWQRGDKFVVDLEGHGREDIIEDVDISRTVGWFTSLFPVVLDMTLCHDIPTAIKENKEMLRHIPNKGIGYGILKYLTPKENKPNVIFNSHRELAFNYLGQFDESFANQEFQAADISSRNPVSLQAEKPYALEITGILFSGILRVTVDYNTIEYDETGIFAFLQRFEIRLREIIDFCLGQEETELTASDLSSSDLSGDEVDTIVDELEMAFNN